MATRTRTHTTTYVFEELLYGALEYARHQAEGSPSEHRKLVVEALEEAVMANDEDRRQRGLEPLGLAWQGGMI